MKVIVKSMMEDREIRVYNDVHHVTATTHYCTIKYYDQNAQIKEVILNLLLNNVKII